jgi:HK97 gp10 family phage protein
MSEKIKGLKVDILGSDEVALLFKNIDLISEQVLDEAALAGANIVKADAKNRVPVDTGDLKNSIDILKKEKSKNPRKKAAYQIGPRYKSKKNPDGVNYGLCVEFGHKTSSGQTVAPHPYLRPAVDNNRGAVMSEVLKKFYDAIGRL